MEHELAGCPGGIDTVGQRTEADSLIVQLGSEVDKALDGAAEPIELPHHQYVTGSRVRKCFRQADTTDLRAARLVGEGAFAPRLAQGIELGGQVLVGRRNPRIAA